MDLNINYFQSAERDVKQNVEEATTKILCLSIGYSSEDQRREHEPVINTMSLILHLLRHLESDAS